MRRKIEFIREVRKPHIVVPVKRTSPIERITGTLHPRYAHA